jgi:thiol-disulfide isomerase/thioredoxin
MLVVPLLGLIVAGGMLIAEATRPQLPAESSASAVAVPAIVNETAPDVPLMLADGQPVRLSDYRGRVVFVNFWATWCPPCIDELPALQDFAADQGPDGAVVLAVNSVESAEQISSYLDTNGINLPDVPIVLDPDAALYRALGILRLPTTWIVDQEGMLRTVKFGAFDRATLDAYLLDATRPDA